MPRGNKMDLTTKLPDELLIQVFGHLPSLRDKLRLESVSHRFQRCLLQLLRSRPIPFILDTGSRRLNGYRLAKYQLPGAVMSLAKKAKFRSVEVSAPNTQELHWILTSLINSAIQCLHKVTIFEVITHVGCSQALLKEALDKCSKLSELKLSFRVAPPVNDALRDWDQDSDDEDDFGDGHLCPMDLGAVLKAKALTQLNVALEGYTMEQVVQFNQSIKPQTLEKLVFRLHNMPLNMDTLVTELGGGAWAALEEIEFHLDGVNGHLDVLLSCLGRLPALRQCYFDLPDEQPDNEWVIGVRSVLTKNREMTVVLDYNSPFRWPGCWVVPLIRQVQAVHPGVKVGFGPIGYNCMLTLKLGKVTLQQSIGSATCPNVNCTDCPIFYPSAICSMTGRADVRIQDMQDEHLDNCRLDRCRIDAIVGDLNEGNNARGGFASPSGWKALSAEVNEAQNLATVTFESLEQVVGNGQVQITVECGHCLNIHCIACLDEE